MVPLLWIGGLVQGEVWGRSLGLEMMLQTGRSRVVVQQATEALETDPDNPEWHALLGISWSRTGYFADALGAFAFAEGAEVYEDLGIEAHATALRLCQDGEAAATLRLQRLLSPVTENLEHRIWMNAADDLREVGQLEAAAEHALQGYGAFPASSVMAALLADIAMDQGDLDEADFQLWRAAQDASAGGPRLEAAQIRRALLDGDVTEALARSASVQRGTSAPPRLGALRAEALRQSGDPEAALAFLERTRWRLSEDPDLLSVRLRVLVDLGLHTEAQALAVRLRALSGHLVGVQHALSVMQPPPQ